MAKMLVLKCTNKNSPPLTSGVPSGWRHTPELRTLITWSHTYAQGRGNNTLKEERKQMGIGGGEERSREVKGDRGDRGDNGKRGRIGGGRGQLTQAAMPLAVLCDTASLSGEPQTTSY